MLSGNLSMVGARQGRDFQDNGGEILRLRWKSHWRGRREGCGVSPSSGQACSSLRACALAWPLPGVSFPGISSCNLHRLSDLSSDATSSEKVTIPAKDACLSLFSACFLCSTYLNLLLILAPCSSHSLLPPGVLALRGQGL